MSTRIGRRIKNWLSTLSTVIQNGVKAVHKLHLSHRGMYSIERLKAYDEFCHRTSFPRVLGICVALPLPALAVAIGMECIPLQNPKDGWRANHGALIRSALVYFLACFGLCLQIRQLIPQLEMSVVRISLVSIGTCVFSLAFQVLVSEVWIYPVPYMYAWGTFPDTVVIVVLFLIAIGKSQFREKPTLPRELWQQFMILSTQTVLCVVYPAYNAVYLRLSPWEKTMFVLFLPVIKFVLQNAVAWSTKHIVEYMPGVTVLSLEVFNALYLAKCMQSQGSMATFAVIMSFDACESIIAYRDMKSQSQHVYDLMKRYNAAVPDRGFVDTVLALCHEPGVLTRTDSVIQIQSPIRHPLTRQGSMFLDELIRIQTSSRWAVNVTAKEANGPSILANDKLDTRSVEKISRLAKIQMPLSVSLCLQVHTTQATKKKKPSRNSMKQRSSSVVQPGLCPSDEIKSKSQSRDRLEPVPWTHRSGKQIRFGSWNKTLPVNASMLSGSAIGNSKFMNLATSDLDLYEKPTKLTTTTGFVLVKSPAPHPLFVAEHGEIVEQSLRILFHCEYHALVEYIEAVVPMLYCIYVSVLTQLPSHVYYAETRNLTSTDLQRMVSNIFAYAWMEIVSFVLMHYTTKWKFGFSPLYLLAFVLENQFLEFQGRLLVCFSYVLEITLVHFGKGPSQLHTVALVSD